MAERLQEMDLSWSEEKWIPEMARFASTQHACKGKQIREFKEAMATYRTTDRQYAVKSRTLLEHRT